GLVERHTVLLEVRCGLAPVPLERIGRYSLNGQRLAHGIPAAKTITPIAPTHVHSWKFSAPSTFAASRGTALLPSGETERRHPAGRVVTTLPARLGSRPLLVCRTKRRARRERQQPIK